MTDKNEPKHVEDLSAEFDKLVCTQDLYSNLVALMERHNLRMEAELLRGAPSYIAAFNPTSPNPE